MAFVMVISNLKSSRWFKIYSRKTLEKRVKKAVFFADFEGKIQIQIFIESSIKLQNRVLKNRLKHYKFYLQN